MERTFDDYRELVNKHLLDFLPVIDNKSMALYESMKYSLTAGGKRIRPVLLLATCEFAGGNIMEALPYAIALEYIHTYSLIHDDLPCMDDDDLRRGLPTNHIVYGEAAAVLAGDGLLTTAFEAINKDMMLYFDEPRDLPKRVRAAYEIAKGAGVRGMIAGQFSDVENEEIHISNEMLEYIHINKTGALIKAAVKAGLHLGNPDEEMFESMETYAENLGLSFQIMDDILDVVGKKEELGKNVGQDGKDHKNTYVSVNGLEAAYEKLDELSLNAKNAISIYYDNALFFSKLIEDMKVRRV